MKRVVSALLAGALFGLGLAVARMTDPTVILGFLDLFGRFDPSLAFVMIGGVGATLIGFRFALGRAHPLLDSDFHVPTVKAIDRPLVVGSAIFGIGWGLAGYCPGPALVALAGGVSTAFVFVPAMIAGSLIQRFVFQRRAGV
ncbi:MAG TPA: YeeE/YedE family protein [Rudaea sp.]|jgi:hypothetical protein